MLTDMSMAVCHAYVDWHVNDCDMSMLNANSKKYSVKMHLPLMQMPTTFEHTTNLPTTFDKTHVQGGESANHNVAAECGAY